MATFLSLPPELREIIYDLVFTTSPPTQNSTALLHRVPGSLALRLTSTFIADESKRAYFKAARQYDTLRHDLIDSTITFHEEISTPVYATGIHATQVAITNRHNLALTLCHPNPRCKHACAQRGCYMCADPEHQSCFDCGRNLAVALYCKIPAHAHEAPRLIARGSNGQPTSYGAWIERFPLRFAAAPREEVSYAMWVPDLDSATGFKQQMAEVKTNSPWALMWWQAEKHRQWFVDVRCEMRRKAVRSHFQQRRQPQFTEAWILTLEEQNPKCKMVQKMGKQLAIKGVMEWKGEYRRRAEKDAERWGWHVLRLIPDYDQKKDAKTSRDAEWFG